MKVGIIGLPATGKTTLFNALTSGQASVKEFGGRYAQANIGIISVPDERFDFLVRVYTPKKISPACIEVVDGAAPMGRQETTGDFGTDFFSGIRAVDALIHVVRAFEDSFTQEIADPLRDVRKVNEELALADLQLVENRLERVDRALRNKKVLPGNPHAAERDILERIQGQIENEQPIKTLELTPDERKMIRSFDLLSLKPMMIVANVGEDGADEGMLGGLREYCAAEGLELIELCAGVEMEIAQLPPNEQSEYLQAMGISESARARVVRGAYRQLGLISFFTVGDDEVRAWTIEKGTRAVDAAGEIHSDLARGFIRAEVMGYDDLVRTGSWEASKDSGFMRLEGKEYVVPDGDILSIRFKV